jgi:hypothetical protein
MAQRRFHSPQLGLDNAEIVLNQCIAWRKISSFGEFTRRGFRVTVLESTQSKLMVATGFSFLRRLDCGKTWYPESLNRRLMEAGEKDKKGDDADKF